MIQSAPRLCMNDGLAGARADALAEIDNHLDNLRRCIHWLVAEGVAILSVDMRRGHAQPLIKVAPSPFLHQLFKNDCANISRRDVGELTIYEWAAQRHGCSIRWEEVNA